MEELDIVFLGGVFTKEKCNEIYTKSKGNIQYAADALQWNIINGLEENLNRPINIVNTLFVGSFPKLYGDIYIKSFRFSHKSGAQDNNIGFLNIFGIKQIFRAINLGHELKKWAKKQNEKKILIIYSLHTPFVYAARLAKKLNPDIHICLIAPDLPEFMNLNTNTSLIIKLMKKADAFILRKNLLVVDSYVLLTKYMADKIPVGDRPYTVVEGMVTKSLEQVVSKNNRSEKILLYTGTLIKAYGIITLIKAFELTQNKDFRLIICGSGEAETDIRFLEKNDIRVKFMGLLPREEILVLQQNARALINPRNAEGEFTKYSFPSKNMEYLLSGRPVIAYKLPGIPDEYDEFLYYINGNSPEFMKKTIEEVLNADDEALEAFGLKAKEFVLREKNNVVQAGKVLNLIKSI
jgi:glycosyltransferase involved in cell wall biosynthesis